MAGEAMRREDALRARTRTFRALVARSAATVEAALQTAANPYVAISGGKDSLVALALAAQQRPGVAAVWVDDELEDTDTPGAVRRQADALGARLAMKTGTRRHAGWFWPWRSPDPWRHPETGCLITRESIRVLAPRWGYDGVILGVRAQESAGRRVSARAHGAIHAPLGADLASIRPLLDWGVADVWAAIGAWELPYHPAYDAMSRAGVPRERQRVGPLCLTPGWILDAAWPGLRRRLEGRYGSRW